MKNTATKAARTCENCGETVPKFSDLVELADGTRVCTDCFDDLKEQSPGSSPS